MNGWIDAIQLNVNDEAQHTNAAAKSGLSRSSASLRMIPLVDENAFQCINSSQIQIECVLSEGGAALLQFDYLEIAFEYYWHLFEVYAMKITIFFLQNSAENFKQKKLIKIQKTIHNNLNDK